MTKTPKVDSIEVAIPDSFLVSKTYEGDVGYYDVLNLGAGTQSTLQYLIETAIRKGETAFLKSILEPEEFDYFMGMPRLSCAVFADTKGEPASVYKHLEWLMSLGGPPIIIASAGNLSELLTRKVSDTEAEAVAEVIRSNRLAQDNNDLAKHLTEKHGGAPTLFRPVKKQSRGMRFVSIPAYTASAPGKKSGLVRRQCTKEFKVEVVELVIRRHVAGVGFRKRFPENVKIRQYFGLSFDEPKRVIAVKNRFEAVNWSTPFFPLFDLKLDRASVISLLKEFSIPHEVPRSACTFCPFRKNVEWRYLRDNDPEGWAEACRVDEKLREVNVVANIGMTDALYLHESCLPLAVAPIDGKDSLQKRAGEVLDTECEGACGA